MGAARNLPWRVNRTGYRVWLSEIMLQQTQVAVVKDYYQRFLEAFPSLPDLAAADQDQVLALWSGLGYYSRGRNLHKAAQMVMNDFQGEFPASYDEILKLPGVGPYTAGAIASLAFGERVPIVDGNVSRVLSRLCDDDTPIDSTAGKKMMQQRASALVDAARDVQPLNEGLMELGALVCTPKNPKCDICPWRTVCRARANQTTLHRPVKKPKKARKHVLIACAVITHGDNIWLERRENHGLFGGMHEPPSVECSSAQKAAQSVRQLLTDRQIPPPKRLGRPQTVRRVLSHRNLQFQIYAVPLSGRRRASPHWIELESLGNIGLSKAVQTVLEKGWEKAGDFFGAKHLHR